MSEEDDKIVADAVARAMDRLAAREAEGNDVLSDEDWDARALMRLYLYGGKQAMENKRLAAELRSVTEAAAAIEQLRAAERAALAEEAQKLTNALEHNAFMAIDPVKAFLKKIIARSA